jgi:alkaline phosphatase
MKKKLLVILLIFLTLPNLAHSNEVKSHKKNVIIMIADGIGMNGWLASNYYLYGKDRGALYQSLPNSRFYGMSHWSKTVVEKSKNQEVLKAKNGYFPLWRWQKFENAFANDFAPVSKPYESYTDSSASASAIFSGEKFYNHALNYEPLKNKKTAFEIAQDNGYKTGVVTSSYFYDATPAATVVHRRTRYLRKRIADDMILSNLDVIIGGVRDDIGNSFEALALQNGFVVDYIEDGFEKTGEKQKYLGLFKQDKKKYSSDMKKHPSLFSMTQKALTLLSQKECEGFVLLVEGGQVDWANHSNNKDYMFFEMGEFNQSVRLVVEWVEQNSNWKDTLLIVTSDHETGGIWGKNAYNDNNKDGGYQPDIDDFLSFDRVKNNGVGNYPDMSYSSKNHTNDMVPLWCVSDVFEKCDLATNYDEKAQEIWGEQWGFGGQYTDNTQLYDAMVRGLN